MQLRKRHGTQVNKLLDYDAVGCEILARIGWTILRFNSVINKTNLKLIVLCEVSSLWPKWLGFLYKLLVGIDEQRHTHR